MLYSDNDILHAQARGDILIKPFHRQCLGPNSYDVHLGESLAFYKAETLDCAEENPAEWFCIPTEGFVVKPGRGYLGVTQEYTEARNCVPHLDGRSGIGRLFLNIHATAGRGDAGFCGYWTLELSVVQPVRVYAGQPIGQLYFERLLTPPLKNYGDDDRAHYQHQAPAPQPSRLHEQPFFAKRKAVTK